MYAHKYAQTHIYICIIINFSRRCHHRFIEEKFTSTILEIICIHHFLLLLLLFFVINFLYSKIKKEEKIFHKLNVATF